MGRGGKARGMEEGAFLWRKGELRVPAPTAGFPGWLAGGVALPTGRCWAAVPAAVGGGCAGPRPVLEGYKLQK